MHSFDQRFFQTFFIFVVFFKNRPNKGAKVLFTTLSDYFTHVAKIVTCTQTHFEEQKLQQTGSGNC